MTTPSAASAPERSSATTEPSGPYRFTGKQYCQMMET